MSLSQLDDDVFLLRRRLSERERELATVREAATDAAEAAALRIRAAQQEAAALRCALDEALALTITEPESIGEMLTEMVVANAAPPSPSPAVSVPASSAPVVLVGAPATASRRSLRRVVALPVWRLIRPVARPMLWRARSFLAADSVREMAALRAAHEAMQDASREAIRDAVQDALSRAIQPPGTARVEEATRRPAGPSHGLGFGDTAAERWLLTAALDCARDHQPS